MIGYLLRTVPTVVRAALRRDGRLVSRLHRRVPLGRVDLNRHMNQAAYAEIGELGRTDWVLRSRALERLRAHRVVPIVVEQHLVYRRELRPLQAFVVDTRAVAVEGRLMRLQTHLLVGSRVHTRIDALMIFVGPDGVLAAERVEELSVGFLTEPLPQAG